MMKTATLEPNADGRTNRPTNAAGWRPAVSIQRVDEPSTNRRRVAGSNQITSVGESSTESSWRAAGVAPVLLLDAPSWVPEVPDAAVWVLGPILLLAAVWWAVRERSASGTQRRARDTSSRVVGGAGLVGLGVVGGLVGALEGVAAALGSAGDIVFAHPTALVELGVTGIGYAALDGALALGADGFALIAGSVILLGIMARN